MNRSIPTLVALLFLNAYGCQSHRAHDGPYRPQTLHSRDPGESERLTRIAAERMDDDPKEAEDLLNRALSADLHNGPAHNNLGILYLRQGRLYAAASEFEWARRLMPGHPDPRLNLGLTLERAGRPGEAIEAYEAALEARPGHLPSVQALARCQLRHGRADARTPQLLRDIALRGDEAWRAWAHDRAFVPPSPD